MVSFLKRLVPALSVAEELRAEPVLSTSWLKPNDLDKEAQARLLRRQKELRDKLEAEGKLALTGYKPPQGGLHWGAEAVWRRYGWKPASQRQEDKVAPDIRVVRAR